jgi:hypothetical protein
MPFDATEAAPGRQQSLGLMVTTDVGGGGWRLASTVARRIWWSVVAAA